MYAHELQILFDLSAIFELVHFHLAGKSGRVIYSKLSLTMKHHVALKIVLKYWATSSSLLK